MGIPWLHGEAPADASKGAPFWPLLQDEAPLYGSGGLPNGRYPYPGSGPHPPQKNWGHPCRLLPAPGWTPFDRGSAFCRTPGAIVGLGLAHPPGRAGKFPYPCDKSFPFFATRLKADWFGVATSVDAPGNLPSGSWEGKEVFPAPGRRTICASVFRTAKGSGILLYPTLSVRQFCRLWQR